MELFRLFFNQIIVVVIAAGWLLSASADETPNYRLPLSILPSSYNLTLTPYLRLDDGAKQFKFDAEVSIDIIPQQSVNIIVLHSKNLNYTKSEYWDVNSPAQKIQLTNPTFDLVTEKITFKLNTNLIANKIYTLHFVYRGQMDDDMLGFYRSSYLDDRRREKWLASTQFETHHARRAFPCFDEPKFKATFQVTIVRHKSFKTVSNTRMISSIQIDANTYADIYERTPPMSTYILAFLVSEFNERSNGDFAVVARPEYYDQTRYSFEVGQKLLTEFDKYLNLPYNDSGIDKMHLAAIPDFSAGAMENWGLLTYRERALLYDETSTSSIAQQSIATIISHEQAHMWFGDIVTCEWWSYTWLNEGFATYFQYMMTSNVYPEWELEKQIVVDQLHTVFEYDATNKTNPMNDGNVTNFDDLKRMFNSISYNKGGSVIRMIRATMGEKAFQTSLQDYLQEKKHSNAVPSDIFKHWENNWPAPTKMYAQKLFDSFTNQVGYPLITVNVSNDGNSMTITQKRFLLNANDGSDASLLYTIPFTYRTDKENNFTVSSPEIFLEPKPNTTKVINLPNINWVIANIQQTGYYRVNYNEENWHKIHHALMGKNWSGIHVLNRAQLVDDLFNLARSNEISYPSALAILEYLEKEINYLPWTAAFNGYNHLAIRLGMSPQKKLFDDYILHQIEGVYNQLGFNETGTDSRLDVYNRNRVLSWACKYGNRECISKAMNMFVNRYPNPIPVNIRPAIYCNAMREDGNLFYELLNRFTVITSPTEKTLILTSLGCVKDTKYVEEYFKIIMSDDIRKQDKESALHSLYTQNPENVSPVFKLVTDNFEKLAASMGSYSDVASVIYNIAQLFTTETQKNDLETFNRNHKHKFGSSASTLERAEKVVAENLLWSAKNLGSFMSYLEQRSNGAATIVHYSWIITTIVMITKFILV